MPRKYKSRCCSTTMLSAQEEQYKCRPAVETIDNILARQIVKARIQRRVKWVVKPRRGRGGPDYQSFLRFVIRTRTLITPLLFVEKVHATGKFWLVIDGNNRLNAIHAFLCAPLAIFDEMIDPSWPRELQQRLQQASYETLISRECGTLKKFCFRWTMSDEYYKTMGTAIGDAALRQREADYETLVDDLGKLRFKDIQVSYSLFENISSEGICELYEAVNTAGMPLTRQEILAASTAHMTYTAAELVHFHAIRVEVAKYYDLAAKHEYLALESAGGDTDAGARGDALNMFELLMGVQHWLHNQYPRLMEPPQHKKSLDVVFHLFEIWHGFDTPTAPVEVSAFIHAVQAACDRLHTICAEFELFSATSRKSKMAPNATNLVFLLVALMRTVPSSATEEDRRRCDDHARGLLLYDILCRLWAKERSKSHHDDLPWPNPLKSGRTTGYTRKQGARLLSSDIHTVFPLPARTYFEQLWTMLLHHNNRQTYVESEKPVLRRTIPAFQELALAIYYHRHLSRDALARIAHMACDHIIPWSLKAWDGEVNLDRLGNRMYIDERTNLTKSNKPLTAAFIQEHKLEYYAYPTEAQYAAIVKASSSNGTFYLVRDQYEKMCEDREKRVIDTALTSIDRALATQQTMRDKISV